MTEVGYALLKLLGNIYPGWVKMLQKDKKYKKDICDSYVQILDAEITKAHLIKLEEWLKSSHNTLFHKWPPQPLELRLLLRSMRHHAALPQPIQPSEPSPKLCIFDPDLCIPRLVCCTILRKNPDNLFSSKNIHLKPYVDKVLNVFKNDLHLYKSAVQFDCIFRDHVAKYGHFSPHHIFKKMVSAEKRDLLHKLIGPVDIDHLLNFFKETRWNKEIYDFLMENSVD